MDRPHPPKSSVAIGLNHDYISNLPADVKESILMKLSIKEAVRTSILSTKWINSWTSIPNLVFEEKSTEYRLTNLVDMVLPVHQGPVQKFKLVSGHDCNEAIGRWMLILSRIGVKDLNLTYKSQEKCKIPFRLFSCIALEHLQMSGYNINVPRSFQGFKLMRTLTLSNFDSAGTSLENLVAACPLLESLQLNSFIHKGCLRILAPSLTSLIIFGDFHDICLVAPNLVSVSIYLTSSGDYQKFSMAIRRKESNISRILGHLHNIQKLEICGDFCDYLSMGPIPEELPAIFNHLTEIVVYLSIYPEEIRAALCLFQNAPNLEVIYIEFWPSQAVDQPKVHASWETKAIDDSLFRVLRAVDIMYCEIPELTLQTTKSILEFAKLVLRRAPVLEKLNIIDLEDGKVIFEMLECFPKLSNKAEIVFIKRLEED